MSGVGYSPPVAGTSTPGQAATVAVDSTTTLPAGSAATVANVGTSNAARLAFGLPAGAAGSTPSLSIAGVTTLAAGVSATASISAGGAISLGIPQGAAGSNATATPLGTATPQPLGTAAAGTSANASREDHIHALPTGRLVAIGNVNVTETLLVSLAVGMKRMSLPLTGVALTDKLVAVPNGTPTAGCEVVNAYPAATANNVSIGYYTPLLGIGATYTVPVTVYRIT